jgi:hypothetical protein
MSSSNPYQPSSFEVRPSNTRKVDVRVFDLLGRGYDLIRDIYWPFLGIAFVGMLLGSFVPLGLLLGPMLIGIYLCLIHRRRGQLVDFSVLFKGFEQFGEATIAWLCIMFASIAISLFLVFVMFAALIGVAALTQGNEDAAGASFLVVMLVLYPAVLVASAAIYIPFLFVFPIMARYRSTGINAIKQSWAGVRTNLWGVSKFVLGNMFLSVILMLMCYIPAILFMPVVFAATFILFEDIYGPEDQPTQPTFPT